MLKQDYENMKKTILFALIACTAFTANAQRKKSRANTSQSNWAVRLGAGFNTSTDDPDDNSSVTKRNVLLAPSVGYFVVDNLEIGFRLSLDNSRDKNVTDNIKYNTIVENNIGFGIYGQKYFPINNWFAFTGAIDLGIKIGNSENTFTNGAKVDIISQSTNAYGASASLGMAFTPVNNLAIQSTLIGIGGLTGARLNEDPIRDVSFNEFGINVWRQPAEVSLVWFFGRGLMNED